MVIAHRGDSGACPENTMDAFRSPVQLSAGMIEFDVQPTRDMELVFVHDEKVDRVTDTRGMAGDLSLSKPRGLDGSNWFTPEFQIEKVSILVEVPEEVPQRVELIELKRLVGLPCTDTPVRRLG